MIRAELPPEAPGDTVPQPKEMADAKTRRFTDPATPPAEDQLPDGPVGPHAAMTRSRPMHPDSARYTPEPAPPQPANVSAGSITCSQCGMANLASGGRQFCGECGANLWEKCRKCESDVPVDERFCGQCGVNIAESVQEQEQAFEEHFANAERLEREHRFAEAKVLLASLAKTETVHLKEHAARAQQKLQHARVEHERWEQLAKAAYKRAQEAFSLCSFEGVIGILEEIPSPLRSTPIVTLLQDASARKAEVEELARQLRELLAHKRAKDILSVIERLQRLQPNHPFARKIATLMHNQLVAKAKQKMAAKHYDAASELLKNIPSSARTEHSESLLKEVDELSALCWDANHCQYVNDTLREVLKRLLRLSKDEGSRKLASEYQKRRKLVDDPDRTEPVPWVKTTKTPWGCPVEWIVEPERIEMDEIPPASRRDHPGSFAVAFGLALQGIGKGPVRVNFNDTSSGVMGRMAKLMREKRHENAWGIDIGDHALKVVKLSTFEGGQRVKVSVCDAIPHRKLLSQAADYGEARDLVGETFEQFGGNHAFKGERLCLALSGRLTICRTVHLPAMAEKKIDEAIRYEAQHVLPGELEEYCWRRYRPDSSDDTAESRTDHLILALTRRHIQYAEETFERLGIQPDILQSEYLALHNYLGFELAVDKQNGDGRQGAAVLLDMGAGGTCMIVHSSRYLWGRYLGVGGHTFSRALVREFHLTLQQAEEWKRDPSRVERWSQWESALGSVRESFSNEFTAALDAFAKDYPGERIERILTVGGGMQMHGLLRHLRTGR